MSFAEFINNEEMTMEQGAAVVVGWFLLIAVAGLATSVYATGI